MISTSVCHHFVEVDIDPRFKDLNLGIMFVADNTYHIGWDSWVCHSSYEEGFTFRAFAIGGSRWSIWKNLLHNCAPCHLPHVDGQEDPSLAIVPIGLHCMLCEKS
jgi:hypothetical protein